MGTCSMLNDNFQSYANAIAFSYCSLVYASYLHDVISHWWVLVIRWNHWDYKWEHLSILSYMEAAIRADNPQQTNFGLSILLEMWQCAKQLYPPPNCNPLWPTYKQFWSPIESWCSVCWKHRSYTRAYSGHEVSLKKQNMKKLKSRPLLKNVWEKTAEISCHLINAGHILLLQSILPWNEIVHLFIGPIPMIDLLQK